MSYHIYLVEIMEAGKKEIRTVAIEALSSGAAWDDAKTKFPRCLVVSIKVL